MTEKELAERNEWAQWLRDDAVSVSRNYPFVDGADIAARMRQAAAALEAKPVSPDPCPDCNGTDVIGPICATCNPEIKVALEGRKAAGDDDGDYVSCESCDNTRVPIEDAIRSEDHYFCPTCHAEWKKEYDQCDHIWKPHVNVHGEDCQVCEKCSGIDINSLPGIEQSTAPAESGPGETKEAAVVDEILCSLLAEDAKYLRAAGVTPEEDDVNGAIAKRIEQAVAKFHLATTDGREWRLFETAPKDGTVVLAYRPDQGVFTAWFGTPGELLGLHLKEHDGIPIWWTTDGGDLSEPDLMPTHWMPLPQEPRATERGGEKGGMK